MMASIPIRYVSPCKYGTQNRPEVTFDEKVVPHGGSVTVNAQSQGGWVFDLNLTGTGQCSQSVLETKGGTFAYVHGFSGDESEVTFTIIHDGTADEIVVTFNTRPD